MLDRRAFQCGNVFDGSILKTADYENVVSDTPSFSRDPRVDWVRGLALLVIAMDHVNGNPLAKTTPFSFCYFDMSEVFVYLSGYVCGLVYSRVLNNGGLRSCASKVLRRWLIIYAAHILTMVSHLIVLFVAMQCLTSASSDAVIDFETFRDNPIGFLLRVVLLQQGVARYDILPVYLALTPLIPLALFLQSANKWVLPIISLSIYLQVVFLGLNNLLPQWHWYFHPLAWQLLFLGGIFLASSDMIREWACRTLAALGIPSLFILIGLVLVKLWWGPNIPLSDRRFLEPICLLHFGSIASVFLAFVLPRLTPKFFERFWPVVRCGQHSLVVYCVGSVLTNLINVFPRPTDQIAAWTVCVNCIACGGCIAAACVASRMKARRRNSEVPEPTVYK
jgi:hypothetical protein